MTNRRLGPFPELSKAGKEQTKSDIRQTAPAEWWVFAYGSLLWDPCFEYDACRRAMLPGYVRTFAMWTVHARGTPETPGLGLCLARSEQACPGLIYRIPPESLAPALDALWEREMMTGIYMPNWQSVDTERGQVSALVFVTNERHPQFAGPLTVQAQALFISQASGVFGSCFAYFRNTIEALKAQNLYTGEFDALEAEIKAVRGE